MSESRDTIYADPLREAGLFTFDVDGEDASEPIKQCTMRITRLPSLGTLNALQPGGGYGAAKACAWPGRSGLAPGRESHSVVRSTQAIASWRLFICFTRRFSGW